MWFDSNVVSSTVNQASTLIIPVANSLSTKKV
nr:MAG TPA: hypothetical protein [Caudoviricetes sp.]